MEKYVELNTFLKLKGAAKSGGEAKNLIRDELVKVNGEIETRNKKKLFAGDVVEYDSEDYVVDADVCQMVKKNFEEVLDE